MGRHVAKRHTPTHVRPRYARITTALAALGTTAVAVMGASGALPAGQASADVPAASVPEEPSTSGGSVTPDAGRLAAAATGSTGSTGSTETTEDTSLPAASGAGRRVVFDMSAQRVWLVRSDGRVRRTYPVSGSLTDNLEPGRYQVYSRSLDAVGVDDSGTMRYMVRFAHGENAAIGFHDIPVDDGVRVQTRAQLGTPQSHGCIRQWRPDAQAMWAFAGVGTTVVVLA